VVLKYGQAPSAQDPEPEEAGIIIRSCEHLQPQAFADPPRMASPPTPSFPRVEGEKKCALQKPFGSVIRCLMKYEHGHTIRFSLKRIRKLCRTVCLRQNEMQIPRNDKIVINMVFGEATADSKKPAIAAAESCRICCQNRSSPRPPIRLLALSCVKICYILWRQGSHSRRSQCFEFMDPFWSTIAASARS